MPCGWRLSLVQKPPWRRHVQRSSPQSCEPRLLGADPPVCGTRRREARRFSCVPATRSSSDRQVQAVDIAGNLT